MRIPGALTMDEGSISHQNGGQMSPQSGSMINNKQSEEINQRTQYSIPGILHFIQHEWARFELERSQWDVDRAELQARIAFLQGERKGQENLKNDLVRRIKMLEYALKQERAKFHKLKYGVDLQQGDVKPPTLEEGIEPPGMDTDTPYASVSNATWRQGRQLLRQYLQEIGYTDRIIDVRSNRVRQMLGLNNNNLANTTSVLDQQQGQMLADGQPLFSSTNGTQQESNKRALEGGRRTPAKKTQPSSLAEAMMLDTEASVMANLDFLSNADVDMDDEGDMDEDGDLLHDDGDIQDDMDDVRTMKSGRKSKAMMLAEGLTDDVDAEAMEVLNELNLLSESADPDNADMQRQSDTDWNQQMVFQGQATNRRTLVAGLNEDEALDSALGLGELAQLTVNNDAETTYDIASNKEAFRKTWSAKYTLRSHFDGVRALAFHPVEPVLITASEDHTLKLWNLQKTVPAKKSASLDVEPLYTFRCHTGPVLCLSVSSTGEHCYSGGLDGFINCWVIPNSHIDPYDLFEPEVLMNTLLGHTDAVWGLAHHQASQSLLSCSADGTVKLWQPHNVSKQTLKQTFVSESDGAPTSVDFVRDETNKVVAAYSNANCVVWDSETGKAIITLQESSNVSKDVTRTLTKESNIPAVTVPRHINKIVCHPTLPLTITAHDDRHIRFWDNNTGKIVHSMVAHLDSVTCLAVDPNGLYLLSGSHDCSIRLWNIENKTCVQEITAHRKKFDESILDVAFHPSRGYIASAGADALAKVFV